MTEGRKSVNLRKETWERLQSFGKFRESTDELLNRLMDIGSRLSEEALQEMIIGADRHDIRLVLT